MSTMILAPVNDLKKQCLTSYGAILAGDDESALLLWHVQFGEGVIAVAVLQQGSFLLFSATSILVPCNQWRVQLGA